jgi:hypothetical protein
MQIRTPAPVRDCISLSMPGKHSAHRCVASLLLLAFIMILPQRGLGLGQPKYVEISPAANNFRLAGEGRAATIFVDSSDYPGVARAARDLQEDIFSSQRMQSSHSRR